jgi:hypothetical protein
MLTAWGETGEPARRAYSRGKREGALGAARFKHGARRQSVTSGCVPRRQLNACLVGEPCATHIHTPTQRHTTRASESRHAVLTNDATRSAELSVTRRPKAEAEGRRPKAEGRRPKAEGRRLKAKANIPKGTDCTNHSYRQYFFMFYFSRFDGGRSSHSERCMPTGHAHLARAGREKKNFLSPARPPVFLNAPPHTAR